MEKKSITERDGESKEGRVKKKVLREYTEKVFWRREKKDFLRKLRIEIIVDRRKDTKDW